MNIRFALTGSAAAIALTMAAPSQAARYISIMNDLSNQSESGALADDPGNKQASNAIQWTNQNRFFTTILQTNSGTYVIFDGSLTQNGFVISSAEASNMGQHSAHEIRFAWRQNGGFENLPYGEAASENRQWFTASSITGYAIHYSASGSVLSAVSHSGDNPLHFSNSGDNGLTVPFSSTSAREDQPQQFTIGADTWNGFDLTGNDPYTLISGIETNQINLTFEAAQDDPLYVTYTDDLSLTSVGFVGSEALSARYPRFAEGGI